MIVSIFSIVQRRQKMQRKLKRNSAKCPSVVFEGVSRADADKSLINLMKFVANYGFYKFGIEISLITFIIVIFVRLDVIASLYVIWFTALVLWNRDQLEKFWIIATHFIAISIIIQSLILAAQIAFNSCSQFSSILQLGTLQYLYHYPSLLFYDFVLLTLMTCQVDAFKSSRADGPNNFNQFGGSNQSIFLDSIYIENIENPLYAFNDKIECFIDLLKHYIFKIQFWVTLSIIFLAGTQQVNLSTFGYIAASFIFFWQGSDFYLKPLKIIVRWWNILLFYNIFIIFGKVVINVIGCNFNQVLSNHYCWVAEWFNVSCAEESTCFSLSRDNSYFWDTIAFAVLILQRRIFMSFYFCNVKNETFITTILASRGAELIEELRMNEMNREIAEEAETLSNLKLKMEKIKSFELAHKSDSNDPLSHIDAIHDGGYYMFDYDEPNAEEVELEQEQEQQLKPTQTVDKIVRFFSTYIDKAKAPKSNQLEETSNTSVHSKLWSTIKIIFSTWLLNVVQRMHCVGRRHYGFIIKMLAQEKKTLKNRMTPGMNNNKFDILNLRFKNLRF